MTKLKRTHLLFLFGVILLSQIALWYGYDVKSIGKLSPMAAIATLGKGVVSAATLFWLATFLVTLFLGRVYCGWLCLFGWYFDIVEKGRARLRRNTLRLPRVFSYIKYLFLVAVIYRVLVQPLAVRWPTSLSVKLATPAPLDALPPLRIALFLLLTLAMTLALGKRAWCKYVCPTGVALSLAGRFSAFKLRLTGECITCGACDRACPQNISVMHEITTIGYVKDTECINCADCAHACPAKVLRLSFPTK